MTAPRQRLGRAGEELAARHLQTRGLRIVDRNWRCTDPALRGELDLVAWDGSTLVFCEVKTRRRADAPEPLESVTPRKCVRLRRLAAAWLAASGTRAAALRFDAIGVSWPVAGGAHVLVHVENAC